MTDRDSNPPAPSILSAWVAGGLLVVVGLQVFASWQTRNLMETVEVNAAAHERAQLQTREVVQQVERLQARVERIQIVADEWEFRGAN